MVELTPRILHGLRIEIAINHRLITCYDLYRYFTMVSENTCFLCAGLLQNNTVQTLMNTCKELLSEYQCVGSVGVTCSNVDLLNVRSYLCGVGKINLQIKTVFKWLMADELTRFLGVPQVLQNASKADDQDLMVSKIVISYQLKLDQFHHKIW